MLTYEFVEKTKNGFVYLYFPEGKRSAPGKIVLTTRKDGTILEESIEDFGGYYAYHAIYGIDLNKATGTIAWY